MTTLLKTCLITATVAMVFALPAGKARAETHRVCFQEYQACIAAGYPDIDCENGYWYCRYGYIPVKAGTPTMTGARQD